MTWKSTLCLLWLNISLLGCQPNTTVDPLESWNRQVFSFNQFIDKKITYPLSQSYQTIVPTPLYTLTDNVFTNLKNIPDTVNNLLQLQLNDALTSTARFMLNATVGLGGLINVSDHFGLPHPPEQNFGNTLHFWGWRHSTFIMLPFFGPTTLRDTWGIPIDNWLLTPTAYIRIPHTKAIYTVINTLHERTHFPNMDEVTQQAFDPYIFIRNAYLQRRHHDLSQKHT